MARTWRPKTVRASTTQKTAAAAQYEPITTAFSRKIAANSAARSWPKPMSMFCIVR